MLKEGKLYKRKDNMKLEKKIVGEQTTFDIDFETVTEEEENVN